MLVDFSDVKDDEFGPMPEGTYTVTVESAEVKETKSRNGEYIKVTFSVFNSNRKLFGMFNIKNDNQQAVDIGKAQLKQLMQCSGKELATLDTVDQLLGLKCQAVVAIEKGGAYKDKNVIKYYKPIDLGTMVIDEPAMPDSDSIPF